MDATTGPGPHQASSSPPSKPKDEAKDKATEQV